MQEIIVGIVVFIALYIALRRLYKSMTPSPKTTDRPACDLGCPGCHLGRHAKLSCESHRKEEDPPQHTSK